jgi:hypothetical protein
VFLLQTAPVTQHDLLAAVAASRSWYDDIFDLHQIPFESDGALWWARGTPPRWHSAVKTLAPSTDPAEALHRMQRHPHGSIADSFGLLDLSPHGFDLLFAATWLHHPGVVAAGAPPLGWVRVRDSDLMDRWNRHHNTVGVLPSDLWAHPRFAILARRDGDALTGGAIIHDAGTVAELSNIWSDEDASVDPRELLDVAAITHPGRAVTGYAWDTELETMLDAGFEPLGQHHVWIR